MIEQNPPIRFYLVERGYDYARVFVTRDGTISIVSSYGNYGYWFDGPGCEIRQFVIGCGDDYLVSKFMSGSRLKELYDADATLQQVKQRSAKRADERA